MTQDEALDILKMGTNVFLTGAAGSGKTHLLNQYISYLTERGVHVGITASTGIAATHIGGMTIHSWSGIGVKESLTPYEIDALTQKPTLHKRFVKTKVLIIDEISMLHAYRLDMIDTLLKTFNRNERPFGGIQIIFCGDFFQLPPISREVKNFFSYESKAWSEANLAILYLTEQHRHDDARLVSILNEIRENTISKNSLLTLQKRMEKKIQLPFSPTKLYTHNCDVDAINERELMLINSKEVCFDMTSKGSKTLVESLKKSVLAPERLKLKKGAVVMFVKNNFERRYTNGTLGVVEEFKYDVPVIRTTNKRLIPADPEDFSIEEEGKIKARVTQIPLRLAWAITIHKSQGMSLDAAEVDLSKSFTRGMGYVALSRIRNLNGLKLIGMNETALLVHEDVLEFDMVLKRKSEMACVRLKQIAKKELKKRHAEFLKRIGAKTREETKRERAEGNNTVPTHLITKKLLSEKHSLKKISEKRNLTLGTIISHIEKIAQEEGLQNISHIKPKTKDLKKISVAFAEADTDRLTPIKQKFGAEYSFDELRLARIFIEFGN